MLLIVMRQSWPEKRNAKPILLINTGANPRNVCQQTREKGINVMTECSQFIFSVFHYINSNILKKLYDHINTLRKITFQSPMSINYIFRN